jgi:hypothetical protein
LRVKTTPSRKRHLQSARDEALAEIDAMEGKVELETVAMKLLELYQVQSSINHKGVEKEGVACMNRILKGAATREKAIASRKISYEALAKILGERGENGRGQEIVSMLDAFKLWEQTRFQIATAGANFEKSLQELAAEAKNGITPERRAALERCWNRYEATYNTTLKQNFVTKNVGAMVAEATKPGTHIADLIAGICAVWSLAGVETDEEECLMRPHPVQIIGIFMLLGLDGGRDALNLNGHLIQVKTGQGKSVLLGVLATALAVCNFDVDCVCYSKCHLRGIMIMIRTRD